LQIKWGLKKKRKKKKRKGALVFSMYNALRWKRQGFPMKMYWFQMPIERGRKEKKNRGKANNSRVI
jgi:hypothetical protein